jgi:hypothetical protein
MNPCLRSVQQTVSERSTSAATDDGQTVVTIAHGRVCVELLRANRPTQRRYFEAKDLAQLNIDRVLLSGGHTWSDWKEACLRRGKP